MGVELFGKMFYLLMNDSDDVVRGNLPQVPRITKYRDPFHELYYMLTKKIFKTCGRLLFQQTHELKRIFCQRSNNEYNSRNDGT